jgi:hypothetical protein
MIPVDYISSLGTRTIDIEMDLQYLAMLGSTGQASFKKREDYFDDNDEKKEEDTKKVEDVKK